MNGTLHITFGPMFSGKTSYLIKNLDNFITVEKMKNTDFKALVINSCLDNRNINKIGNLTTHSELTHQFKGFDVVFANVKNLQDISQKIIDSVNYIAIDECQFFDDLETYVKKWMKENKHIHCSGLIADFERNKFGQLLDLFPLASDVNMLKSFCAGCKKYEKTASFTMLKCNEVKSSKINIGDSKDYAPVCQYHYTNTY
jgi:thymidine kinase